HQGRPPGRAIRAVGAEGHAVVFDLSRGAWQRARLRGVPRVADGCGEDECEGVARSPEEAPQGQSELEASSAQSGAVPDCACKAAGSSQAPRCSIRATWRPTADTASRA